MGFVVLPSFLLSARPPSARPSSGISSSAIESLRSLIPLSSSSSNSSSSYLFFPLSFFTIFLTLSKKFGIFFFNFCFAFSWSTISKSSIKSLPDIVRALYFSIIISFIIIFISSSRSANSLSGSFIGINISNNS